MLLHSLVLHNFRNYADKTIAFSPTITHITGQNATGKTNILEAIHLICTGKGIKDERQEEMLHFGSSDSDVYATFTADEITTQFRIHFEKNEKILKTYFVDTAKKLLYTYVRFTQPVVLFTPELISIIDGSPSQRRNFIDQILSRIDIHYQKTLQNYENGLRKRNRILESTSDPKALKESLHFWDQHLIKHATYLVHKRQWFCTHANAHTSLGPHAFHIEYIPNEISEKRFHEYFIKETYQKRTLIGPQRDEFTLFIKAHDVRVDTKKYASRGEQRLALFWLILKQLEVYSQELKIPPLLLLDDIFSELDDENRHIITDLVATHQTVVTATHPPAQYPSDTQIIAL